MKKYVQWICRTKKSWRYICKGVQNATNIQLERIMNKELENKLRPFLPRFLHTFFKKKFIYSEKASKSEEISLQVFWPSQKTLTLRFVFLLLHFYKLCQMHKLDKLSIAIPSIEVSGHVLDDRTEKQISIHLNFLSVHFQNGFTLDRSTLIFFGCYICICWRVHFPILFFFKIKTEFPSQCLI